MPCHTLGRSIARSVARSLARRSLGLSLGRSVDRSIDPSDNETATGERDDSDKENVRAQPCMWLPELVKDILHVLVTSIMTWQAAFVVMNRHDVIARPKGGLMEIIVRAIIEDCRSDDPVVSLSVPWSLAATDHDLQ